MPTSATMSSASTVYYGPDSTNYASVGSVFYNEQVQVYAMEKNWFFIEYSTGATTKKRGYVPYSTVNNAAAVASSVPTRLFTGYADVSNQALSVFTGPGTTAVYPSPGTVYAGEGFTRFNETSGNYTYVEYSTPSGTRRGYALTSQLAGRNRGVLADVSVTSATVYSGPKSTYVVSGTVFRDEYVVILERDMPPTSPAYYLIEYNSLSGRKRGYVDQNSITPCSSLSSVGALKLIEGAASVKQNVNVYAGPNQNFALAGSVFTNEIVHAIEGVPAESAYTFVEYSTPSGKKRGYVSAEALQALPGYYATMAIASNVYYGPDSTNYASVGSVEQEEPVQVLATEKNWFFIEYSTSSNNKCGYVPYDALNNPATAASSVPARTFTGVADVTIQNVTVFTGPNDSYAVSGSLYSGEGLTRFNESSGSYTYVEYSTPSGTKRGYVETAQLAGRNRGVLADVTAVPAAVFSGPDETYFHSGSVFLGEYVVILERDITSVYPSKWYYIEYNSPSGRKRGYINQNRITPLSSLSSVEELRTGNGLALAQQNLTVYSGPDVNFATVGTIFANERVSVLDGVPAESSYSYIEYNIGSYTSKRGYVQASFLQSTSVTLPVISTANVTEGTYGLSGNSRPLKYYKIGNGPNVLAAVFGVHGFEDAWAADGEELAKIAKTLIDELVLGSLTAWSIYVIPSANPDGILDGWTNNGPGRTTVSAKKDINRSFPTNFLVYLDSRNYNGTTSLGSQEALALSEILLQWKSEASTMVLLDVHGWLNQSIGDSIVGQHFASQFGFSHTALGESARGYLTRWGQANGMLVSLIELPFPSSPQDIITRDFSGKFVQATRNMLNTIAQSIAVTGVTVSPTEFTLNYEQTQQLIATVSPANATNKAVEWSSSNTNVATVNSTGLVTAGTNSGAAIITVTTVDGGFEATSTVNVSAVTVPVEGIAISPLLLELNVGESQQLTKIIYPANATNQNVIWSSDKPNVASVDNNGMVTAGLVDDTATITATTEDGGFSATTTVIVSGSGTVPAGYTTYKLGATLPSGGPFDGWAVNQGFNDKDTDNQGHLGYDIALGTTAGIPVKPIFGGKVVFVRPDNSTWNGRIVVIEHNLPGVRKFYSSYSHLQETEVTVGDDQNPTYVTTDTVIGTMGGSADGSDTRFGPHVHLCTYTRDSYHPDPFGYCGPLDTALQLHLLTFEDAAGINYNDYYYGGDESKFPRSDGCVFYDPFGVVSTNGQIIEAFHP